MHNETSGGRTPSAGERAASTRQDAVRALAEQLPALLRRVQALKAGQDAGGRDRAALVLLFPLQRLAPLRQGALAELLHADPSTVSRHVASLAEQGLVRRVADENDGRASRLVLTDEGLAMLDVLRAERAAHLERVTTGWDADDLSTLTTLLGRLIDDIAAHLPGGAESAAAPGPCTDPARENR